MSSDIRHPKAQTGALSKTPQCRQIHHQRPDSVPQEPVLHLLLVVLHSLLLRLGRGVLAFGNHTSNGARDEGPEEEVRAGEDGAVGVPALPPLSAPRSLRISIVSVGVGLGRTTSQHQ